MTGPAGLRFYAGAPLVAPDRSRIGTICVLDRRPRRPSARQRQDLVDPAGLAIDQLELRCQTGERARAEADAEAERARLASVIENLPFEFWLCDADGRCLLQSAKSRRHWGDQSAGCRGIRGSGRRARPLDSNQDRLLAGETVRAKQLPIGGRSVDVEEILTPLRDRAGRSPATSASMSTSALASEPRRGDGRARRGSRRRSRACRSTSGSATRPAATSREHRHARPIGAALRAAGPTKRATRPTSSRSGRRPTSGRCAARRCSYEASYGEGSRLRHVETLLAPVQSDGRDIGLVGVNIDITKRKRAEEQYPAPRGPRSADRPAEPSPVPGAPRARRCSAAAAAADAPPAPLATRSRRLQGRQRHARPRRGRLGCPARWARRLHLGTAAAPDTVARLGGDEFAILLEDLTRPCDAEIVARKVVAGLAVAFRDGNRELHPSASLGIALFPRHGRSAGDMLKAADLALYRAKDSGGGGWQVYDEELRILFDRR